MHTAKTPFRDIGPSFTLTAITMTQFIARARPERGGSQRRRWFGPSRDWYDRPASRRRCSVLAARRISGDWNRSQAVAASTRAARTIPLRPMVVPPAATACQEWAEVPGTQQAVVNPAVGTTQETSPTSVEPEPPCPLRSATPRQVPPDAGGSDSVLRMPAANSASLASYCRSFCRIEFRPRHLSERVVGHDLQDTPEVLRLQPGFGGQCAGLGAFEQAGIELLHDLGPGWRM